MADPRRLTTRAKVERRKAAAHILAQQLHLPGDVLDALSVEMRRQRDAYMRSARVEIRDEQERIFAGGFNMFSIEQYNHVVRQLMKLPRNERRSDCQVVFMFLVGLIEKNTAEILWTRKRFADELGILPRNISSAMTTLERIGAVRRVRHGRGVTYYVNANVAFNGDPEHHKIEAAKSKPPTLHLLEGGAP